MSSTMKDDGSKWIQTGVTICCLLLSYILISFFGQLGEWFEWESKIKNFVIISQVVAVLISLGVFIFIMRHPQINSFLKEVYQETAKVVWPDKNETVRHTVQIMIGVSIIGFVLGFFDWVATTLLGLIH